ncbi:hypothetical protein KDX27_23335 [Burkholderia cenocepacia]|nr:hypothetical protein [Burkholderia sp. 9777_1386]MBN3532493.1 hypothetical protein [Burkholderia cenocepacia]MBO1859044.1 hypothetical protein [Burkholderia cenocepacia]MBR7907585.1 hypothetical protein [Burkholderia cenocepacia]MBR7939192.1 hypothetical protein [Burkholderia cenocepacia]
MHRRFTRRRRIRRHGKPACPSRITDSCRSRNTGPTSAPACSNKRRYSLLCSGSLRSRASRAYLAQNSLADRARSQLSFYEITNGQHFDAFLSVAGFDTRFIPVRYYYLQALDRRIT